MSDKDEGGGQSAVEVEHDYDVMENIKRGKWMDVLRVGGILLIGLIILKLSTPLAILLGEPGLAPFGMWSGLACLGGAVSHVLRRMFFPYLNMGAIAKIACREPKGAGTVFLGACLVLAALILTMGSARAGEIPANALIYAPVLKSEAVKHWPEFKGNYHILAGQVEQESCISLTNKKCWTPFAELKTARERGVGFGQITKTERFDSLTELQEKYKAELGGWGWGGTLYDPHYQMRGLVLMNKGNYQKILGVANERERIAMTLVAYNGGLGRVMSDRKLCDATVGCNSKFWFGHAEKISRLPKVAVSGYGMSFFQINREYPHRIMEIRSEKYKPLFV
jgi:hypothetical protein